MSVEWRHNYCQSPLIPQNTNSLKKILPPFTQNTNHTHPSNIQAMIEHNWEKNGSTNSTEHIQSQNTLTRNTLTRNTLTRNTSQTEHILCPRKIGAFILKTGRQREAICISQERGILLLLLYSVEGLLVLTNISQERGILLLLLLYNGFLH